MVEIRRITTVEDADVLAITELMTATSAVDAPWMTPMSPEIRRVFLEQGWDGEPPLTFLGEEDGRLVAVGYLDLPQRDNQHLAWVDVRVRPDHRRRGLGTEVFEHLSTVARESGRTSVGIDGWESDACTGFAARHGFERKSQAIMRRLDPQRLDRDLLAKQIAEAEQAAAGYELVRVFGRTPEELLEQASEITGAINDAPTDDLDIEDSLFSVERLREYEDSNLKSGRPYTIYARHTATGELAGKTIVLVRSDDATLANQHDTSVVRDHRGHRLGLLLKADMLRWLAEAEPQVEHIDTENAESNDHMIAVNEQLGFVVLARELEFQRDL